jgi:hypothetical protein
MKYHSTEYPISWLRDRQLEGNVILQKAFLQRRLVWKLRQKSHLVESILMGYPIPEIYIQLRTTSAGESSFTVVDGQQRISAILAFLGLKEEDEDNGFELAYLDPDSEWRNLSWDDLTEEQRARFFGHLLTVRILDDFSDEQIRDLFRRLNKYLTKLSDQEIRNATYSGPLIRFAQSVADDGFWAENRIVSAEDIRRMRDIEFMSELTIGLIHGPQGGSRKVIDDFYAQYEEYGEEFPSQVFVRRRFARTLETIQELFPDIKTTRWRNKTDFYTLFVALAHLMQEHRLGETRFRRLRKSLDEFAGAIGVRLADERATVSDAVVQYVRAVEKGVSDKARRANRHRALLEIISPHFTKRRGS